MNSAKALINYADSKHESAQRWNSLTEKSFGNNTSILVLALITFNIFVRHLNLAIIENIGSHVFN